MSTRLSSILPAVLVISLPAAGILLAPGSTQACSIPVFRYAFQFWEPDPYDVLIFHKGALSEEDEKAVKRLTAAADPERRANVNIQRVDLAGEPGEALEALWKQQGTTELPHVLMLYPESYGPAIPAESGSLAEFKVEGWTTSPARKTSTERITKGDSAVWVLLECGDEKKDTAAANTLKETLAKLEKSLQLPEQVPETDLLFETGFDVQADLRLAFSTLRVSRQDPAEKHFVDHLLNSEDDLRDFDEPMVFAVFGRGRMLPALVGKGINEDVMTEVASFLVGPCSCQIKAQNPGVDLLISVDWENLLHEANAALAEQASPVPSAAVAPDALSSNDGEGSSNDGEGDPPAPAGDAPLSTSVSTVSATAPSPSVSPAPEDVAISGAPQESAPVATSRGPLYQGVLILVGLGLAALLAATVVILVRKSAASR